MLLNTFITLIAIGVLVVLFSPGLRDNRNWQATVTPLASVVGSGFLIVAPLLHQVAEALAPLVMLAIVIVAAALGAAVRYNIRYLEPVLRHHPPAAIARLESLGDASLVLAYVISVAFYLSLLSAFVWRFAVYLFPFPTPHGPQWLTTVVLVWIAAQGWRGGLQRLERLEEYSVSIKLAIIAAVLVALGVYGFEHPLQLERLHLPNDGLWERLRLIAGTLLIVQGFETSRYLGEAYDRETRIASMARAQWISGVIYVAFVLLMMPLLYANGPVPVNETAIIDLSLQVAGVLAPLLLLAAVMSQFSAAVADTLGAGGIVHELSGERIGGRWAYLLLCAAAITLVWNSDTFEIIAIASRAFAFYYLVQCLLNLAVRWRNRQQKRFFSPGLVMTSLLALLMLVVVFFARAVG